jgi:hypothetical protein
MDKRLPQRSRLWSGGAYDSDTEDPDNLKSEINDLTAISHMKVCLIALSFFVLRIQWTPLPAMSNLCVT